MLPCRLVLWAVPFVDSVCSTKCCRLLLLSILQQGCSALAAAPSRSEADSSPSCHITQHNSTLGIGLSRLQLIQGFPLANSSLRIWCSCHSMGRDSGVLGQSSHRAHISLSAGLASKNTHTSRRDHECSDIIYLQFTIQFCQLRASSGSPGLKNSPTPPAPLCGCSHNGGNIFDLQTAICFCLSL